eukprot:TRINITY_DN6381_c0_g2_i1.p1 TRINITY_DN6381_c0_g2~~TRINITY_DN6381_c0_g2_i1.p1  ORF type:complete len:970 (+),score=141.85 TRINITY_DN6381_c0_g2_i1:35-2944(+)
MEFVKGVVGEFIPEFAVEGRVLAAEQKFERQLKQWEFSIERQKLFREDIRDLVELTVGRMDIYHLVGALLLEFCMSFYCENEMLSPEEHSYPTWLISLFMMSNFCAIGFLTLAVWLAMHASVASHSIGVRLLLRLVRLDVPSPDAIGNLKVPLVSMFGSKSEQEPNPTGAAAVSVDERNHFKEFLQRQRAWMCYDAYSRLCMSLGMNAMMIALSYYIIGRISQQNAVSAVSSLLGVQLLSLLLLTLDIRHDRPDSSNRRRQQQLRCIFRSALTDRYEAIAVFLFLVFPPVLALSLVLLWPHMQERYVWTQSMRLNTCLSTVSFVLHACWLEYLHTMANKTNDDMMPRRLRAVEFMDVMSPDDMELGAEDCLEHLCQARKHLQTCMKSDDHRKLEGLGDKLSSQLENAHRARSMIFAAERPQPYTGPMDAREAPRHAGLQRPREAARSKREELDREIFQSEQFLRCFRDMQFLLNAAPLILGNIKSLQAVGEAVLQKQEAVKGLNAQQQEQLGRNLEKFQRDYEDCRQRCLSGIKRTGVHEQICFSMGKLADHPPLPIVMLKREDPDTHACSPEWYRPESPATVLREMPTNRRSTTFGDAMTLILSWNQTCTSLIRPEMGDENEVSVETQQPDAVDPGGDSNAQLPQMVDKLPRDVVMTFMRGCMFLWLSAAAAHMIEGLVRHELDVQSATSKAVAMQTQQLHATWPAPAGLFQVGALHCVNDSVLLVSSRFNLYAVHGQPWGMGLHDIQETNSAPAGVVLCNSACDALVRDRDGWTWAPVTELAGSPRPTTSVPVPASWRLVAAMQEPCEDASIHCESVLLAGWTGAEIEVAEARRDPGSGSWHVQNRFAVPADVAACDLSLLDGSCPATGEIGIYTDVRALQLGQGRTLAVLLGEGRLDGWDLRNGMFLGQWRMGHGNYTSMCHGANDIVLVQRGGDLGPQLEIAALPAPLSRATQTAGAEYERWFFE